MPVFKIAHVPGRGKGMIATEDLKRGDPILFEFPLFILPLMPDETNDAEKDIADKLRELSIEDRRKFFSLTNNFPKQKPFTGLVRTNAQPTDEQDDEVGIFENAARMNHSCTPNANQYWDDDNQQLRVFATTDIKEGEEITISYLPIYLWVLSREERQIVIKSYYEFECRCKICTKPDAEIAKSDARRCKFAELQEAKPVLIGNDHDSKALLYCKSMLKILEEEGDSDSKAVIIYHDASHICLQNGEMARAKAFAKLAAEGYVEINGGDGKEEWEGDWKFMLGQHHPMELKTGKWRKIGKEKNMRWKDDEGFEEWLWALAY